MKKNRYGSEVGTKVKVSNLAEGDIAIYKKRKFMVTEHIAEDRASGSTDVVYEDGETFSFVWDFEDPNVLYLGRGGFAVKITEEGDIESTQPKSFGRFDDL